MCATRRFDVNGDGFLGHDESRLMFRALIASSPDPAKRKRAHLAERHFNALFDFLDQDHSDSINFHEIAMAIRCAEVDPYLATMFSSEQLEDVRGGRELLVWLGCVVAVTVPLTDVCVCLLPLFFYRSFFSSPCDSVVMRLLLASAKVPLLHVLWTRRS